MKNSIQIAEGTMDGRPFFIDVTCIAAAIGKKDEYGTGGKLTLVFNTGNTIQLGYNHIEHMDELTKNILEQKKRIYGCDE